MEKWRPILSGNIPPTYTHLDGLIIGVGIALIREHKSSWWETLVANPWIVFLLGIIFVIFGLWLFESISGKISM